MSPLRDRGPTVRVAAFLAAYFLILFVASVPKGMVPRPFADLAWGTLSSAGVLALTLWMLRLDGTLQEGNRCARW